MANIFRILLAMLIISNISQAKLLVDDECSTDRLSCPENSKCRPLSCRGYRCACDEGFMPSENSTKCIKGAALDEECGSTNPPCLNANAVCLKGLISLSPPKCQCEKGYINANNQCLIQTNYKRFGEWCEKECGPTLTCKLGFCQCQPGYRQRTTLEIQADPTYEYDCIENEFSLSKCKGVDVLLMGQISANSLSNTNPKTSTDPNANSTDTTLTINQSTELESSTTQYNLTSSKSLNQSSDSTTPTSVDTSTTLFSPKGAAPSIPTLPTIQTTITIPTTPLSQSSLSYTNETSTNFTLTSPKIKGPTPAIHAATHVQKTATDSTTDAQSRDTPSHTSRLKLSTKSQTLTTATSILTSPVGITNSIPTQSTEKKTPSSPATTPIQVSTSSSPTTGQASDPQSQTTLATPHWTLSSASTEKHDTLPTIPSQPELPTKTHPTTNAPVTHGVQTSEATSFTVDKNITTMLSNKSAATRAPATQTRAPRRPSASNRISTEAIVIPSVLVIVLAIVITSVIAIVICRKRRSNLSLSSDTDNGNYKLPRPSVTSQALTSAPSPPSPYNTGSHPSYHYVNDAFENDRL